MFQSILEFKNKKKKLKKETLKQKNFHLNNDFIHKIYTKTKSNFLFDIYEKLILKFTDPKILINIRTKKN